MVKKLLLVFLMVFALSFAFACNEDKKEDDDKQNEEAKEFIVTFDVDGEKSEVKVKEGEKASKPADPEKEGYTFLGWYVGEEAYDFGSVTADVTVTAKFEEKAPEVKEFTVKFVADGEVTETKVKEGEKAVKPIDPVKEGYVFLGWYVGEEAYDFENAVTADVELVAKFEEAIVEYTVKFVVDGEASEVKVAEGEKAVKPADPVKEGFVFLGWYVGEEAYDFENAVTSDLEVVAKFEEEVAKVNINYTLMGGSFGEDVEPVTEVEVGTTVYLVNPTRRGYIFQGWSLERNGTEFIDKIENISEDVKVYAVWKFKTTVDITFDYNGGVSENLYKANGTPLGVIAADNYNYNNGTFWGGAYTSYIFLGTKNYDPGATFSYRLYIGKNTTSGLYEIKGILLSGGSSWAEGAEYVLTISSSYKNYRNYSSLFNSLEVGMVVVLDGVLDKSCSTSNPINVKIYNEEPTNSVYQVTKNDSTILETPSRLGYDFLGWYIDGSKINSINEVTMDSTVKAEWEELNPVTDIKVNNEIEQLLYGDSYKLDAEVVPSDAYYKTISYTSSNPDVISVDENGNLFAVNCGVAEITLTDFVGRVSVTKKIAVTAIPSIELTFSEGYNGTLGKGQTVTITPEAYGTDLSDVKFNYESTDTNVLLVNDEGLVTAMADGKASIKITDNSGSNYMIEVIIKVGEIAQEDKIDQVLKLISDNNFASVHYGNACLYNDGLNREYDSIYGSVNNYLFDEYVVNTDYVQDAINYTGGHQDRTPGIDTIQFVTVHDTATLTGTVQSIASYMSSGETSIHYTTGNDKIYQVVPEEYIAYHAGDGTGTNFRWTNSKVKASANVAPEFDLYNNNGTWCLTLNGEKTTIAVPLSNGSKTITNPSKRYLTNLGPTWKVENGEYYIGNMWVCFSQVAEGRISSFGGNNNSIGIEMCVNYTNDIYDTYQRTAQLVADILVRNNLDVTRVKQHNTWSGKNCPQVLIAGDYWWEFIDMVEMNYQLRLNYSDVKITMKSNNPDIVDNTGRVYNPPKTSTTVSYDVTVSLGDQSKTITLYSYVAGTTCWERWDGSYPSSLIWNNGKFNLKK